MSIDNSNIKDNFMELARLPVQLLRYERKKRLVRWRLPGIISTRQTDYVQLKPKERSQENENESPQ